MSWTNSTTLHSVIRFIVRRRSVSLQPFLTPIMNEELKIKAENLKNLLAGLAPFAIACSGGMDSSFLLEFSRTHSFAPLAISVLSPFSCFDDANTIRNISNVKILEAETLPPEVLANPVDRCYHCKKYLFEKIIEFANQEGYQAVCDGSNIDDDSDYRPGKKALLELGVISPLGQCGFSKADICAAIEYFNLPVEALESNSCLAARIPYGNKIDIPRLKSIDEAERYLRSLGFSSVRVRDHAGLARIEVDPSMRMKFADKSIMEAISDKLKDLGFSYVTLDLTGYRRGSLNESILKPKKKL